MQKPSVRLPSRPGIRWPPRPLKRSRPDHNRSRRAGTHEKGDAPHMAVPAGRPLAVITSASGGVGYELAGQFAKAGFDLIVAAEDDGIAAAARSLEGFGGQAIPAQIDLSSYDEIENLYLTIQGAACPVAALAINAQAGFGGDFVRDSQLADELRLVTLNATGAVHLTKRVLADMLAHDSGSLLFILPEAGPGLCHATYTASTA